MLITKKVTRVLYTFRLMSDVTFVYMIILLHTLCPVWPALEKSSFESNFLLIFEFLAPIGVKMLVFVRPSLIFIIGKN